MKVRVFAGMPLAKAPQRHDHQERPEAVEGQTKQQYRPAQEQRDFERESGQRPHVHGAFGNPDRVLQSFHGARSYSVKDVAIVPPESCANQGRPAPKPKMPKSNPSARVAMRTKPK